MFKSQAHEERALSAIFVVSGNGSYPTTDLRNQWKLGRLTGEMKV